MDGGGREEGKEGERGRGMDGGGREEGREAPPLLSPSVPTLLSPPFSLNWKEMPTSRP